MQSSCIHIYIGGTAENEGTRMPLVNQVLTLEERA